MHPTGLVGTFLRSSWAVHNFRCNGPTRQHQVGVSLPVQFRPSEETSFTYAIYPQTTRKHEPERVLRLILITNVLLMLANAANAQSALEHHLWQDARPFTPYSRTASAITGTIELSGNPDFATKGSLMKMTFANGVSVGLKAEAASYRHWDIGSEEKSTAEVFEIINDPGELENGNSLCGDRKPKYAVFSGSGSTLNLAVFGSETPPRDINSVGLCGTFSYDAGPVNDQATRSATVEMKNQSTDSREWHLQTTDNPIDDSKTVTLSLASKSGVSRAGKPIVFVGRCKSNKTEAFVDWGDYLGDDSSDVYSAWKDVIIRIGKSPAHSQRWGISTDRKATFALDWPGALLKDLLDQDRLVLQTTPYGENPTTAIFDVSGLRDVLGDLAKRCNWSFK